MNNKHTLGHYLLGPNDTPENGIICLQPTTQSYDMTDDMNDRELV
ncbi:unnamed protein product, partial [marine sediment metagenome]